MPWSLSVPAQVWPLHRGSIGAGEALAKAAPGLKVEEELLMVYAEEIKPALEGRFEIDLFELVVYLARRWRLILGTISACPAG